MKRNRVVSAFVAVILSVGAACSLVGCAKENDYHGLLNPKNPVSVEIWNYYSGAQANGFEELVKSFNDTVGRETGIIVTTTSQSDIDVLANGLLESVDGKVGAKALPDAAQVYPETAFLLKEKDAIVPIEKYLTKAEWSEYIPSFLDNGRFGNEGEIYGFPISKSTEIVTFNKTDWEPFETYSGISLDEIETINDMADAAKKYYEWTDSLTPSVREDGKALYGRDSYANYLYVGAAKLGHEIVTVDADEKATVNLDKETFRTLWDNFYIPYINGYFAKYDKFCSGDLKTGKILAFIGSTSSVNYIEDTVTDVNEQTHDIELSLKKPLKIDGQQKEVYVQQGASYYVLKSTEARQYAVTQFFKWFTQKQQNVLFSVGVGYSPVKKDSNVEEVLTEAMSKTTKYNETVLSALKISSDIFNNSTTYASPPFKQAKDLRSYLENSFRDVLVADRTAVKEAIDGGKTREEATAEYVTDDYFDTWFNQIKLGVEELTR